MSQFNNLNYLRSDRNLVLESAYSSRTVTSSDKLFHAILENNDTHKANHERNKANNWVANYDQGLLFRIAGKYINVPTFLSLHLVLDSLIKNGEDVNAIDKNKDTPLHRASFKGNLEIAQLLKIVDHLDKNKSIDNITSDIDRLTSDEIKGYYNENKVQIDSLMEQRKNSQVALSIVHIPDHVVLHENVDKEKVIKHVLILMKANKGLQDLPALSDFLINTSYIPPNLFLSLQDSCKLAQVNKVINRTFSEKTGLSSADNYLSKLGTYLINHKNGIQILINANKNKLVS